jgi:hypothetical protein
MSKEPKDPQEPNDPKVAAAEMEQLFFAQRDAELINRNQTPSESWLWSPARLELLSIAFARLGKVSELRGGLNMRPTRVQVAISMPSKKLYIYPLDKDSLDGFAVMKRPTGCTINIRTLLEPRGLLVEPHYRARFAAEFADETSPVGAALVIDLGAVREKSRIPVGKPKQTKTAKKSEPTATTAVATDTATNTTTNATPTPPTTSNISENQ